MLHLSLWLCLVIFLTRWLRYEGLRSYGRKSRSVAKPHNLFLLPRLCWPSLLRFAGVCAGRLLSETGVDPDALGFGSKARIPAMPPHCLELMLEMIATVPAHFEASLLVGFSSVRTVGFFSVKGFCSCQVQSIREPGNSLSQWVPKSKAKARPKAQVLEKGHGAAAGAQSCDGPRLRPASDGGGEARDGEDEARNDEQESSRRVTQLLVCFV